MYQVFFYNSILRNETYSLKTKAEDSNVKNSIISTMKEYLGYSDVILFWYNI